MAADPGAMMRVGLREALDADELARWATEQDAEAMLAALHEVPVRAGDALLVPAGTLHAIGEGVLVVEVHEPTDLSVPLERRRFGMSSGPEHLALGWPLALESVDPLPRRRAARGVLRRPARRAPRRARAPSSSPRSPSSSCSTGPGR